LDKLKSSPEFIRAEFTKIQPNKENQDTPTWTINIERIYNFKES